MNEILLYSGGMDSYIAWYYLQKPRTLFVNLGHRYWEKEYEVVLKTIPETLTLRFGSVGRFEEEDANIPMRNLFLSMCAVWEGASQVWMIVQKDEMSIPDRSESFFRQTSDYLSFLAGRKIVVDTPFREMDKTDMVEWYLEKGYPAEDLLKTVGCFSFVSGHCGDCGSCFRRFVALKNNGIDPGYDLTERIKEYYQSHLGGYSEGRKERMKKWLSKDDEVK